MANTITVTIDYCESCPHYGPCTNSCTYKDEPFEIEDETIIPDNCPILKEQSNV